MKIYFSHGKKGTPDGRKIIKLSNIAKNKGFEIFSIDYTDVFDPEIRAQRLLDFLEQEKEDYVLVGSSMGGYISLVAEEIVENKPIGIFLMAPALYLENYKKQTFFPKIKTIEVVHGWNDEVVSFTNSIKFCKQNNLCLHLLNSDHRLLNKIDEIQKLFGLFLDKLTH
ncbi:MAG TPA: alpha/beta hydrolase [Bacteroidetes bacterium]|nr:alpha/beta hydrolase [Bacteroidota bacterium]